MEALARSADPPAEHQEVDLLLVTFQAACKVATSATTAYATIQVAAGNDPFLTVAPTGGKGWFCVPSSADFMKASSARSPGHRRQGRPGPGPDARDDPRYRSDSRRDPEGRVSQGLFSVSQAQPIRRVPRHAERRIAATKNRPLRPGTQSQTKEDTMRHLTASVLATTALLLAGATAPALAGPTTERVSVSSAEEQAEQQLRGGRHSRMGWFVVFNSLAQTSSPRTRTAPRTSSCATGRRARPRSSASARPGSRGTASARGLRCRGMGASSRSLRGAPRVSRRHERLHRPVRARPEGEDNGAGVGGPRPSAGRRQQQRQDIRNGRFVAFNSSATNRVSGDTTACGTCSSAT